MVIIKHALAMIQPDFIIAAQSARLVEPSESSLDDPSFRQNFEAFGVVTLAQDDDYLPQKAEA